MRKFLTVMIFFLFLMAGLETVHSGIYLKVSDTGAFSLTNKPSDKAFQLIVGASSRRQMNLTKIAVERASGVQRMPESLIFSIIKNNSRQTGGIMGLSTSFQETLSDTAVNDIRRNIMLGTNHLRNLLTNYEGNLTLALGAYYAGEKAVDKANGIPTEAAREFVTSVRKAFFKIDKREEIFYTFRNSEGVLTVVNIGPTS
jgi:soluble lytic murein transglycosylase-like protein